jgi:hypothetical protein
MLRYYNASAIRELCVMMIIIILVPFSLLVACKLGQPVKSKQYLVIVISRVVELPIFMVYWIITLVSS